MGRCQALATTCTWSGWIPAGQASAGHNRVQQEAIVGCVKVKLTVVLFAYSGAGEAWVQWNVRNSMAVLSREDEI